MEELPIYRASVKRMPPGCDVKHCLEVVFMEPGNKWIFPTNSIDSIGSYSIFYELSRAGIVASKRVPIWKDGSFLGYRILFLYNKHLNYYNLP